MPALQLLLQEIVQHRREAAILDEELLVVHRAVEKINCRRDGRSARRRDPMFGVVKSRSKKIAVRTPITSKKRAEARQGFMFVAAAKQKLGGTHGAGRDN